jgi:parvulin-like peptidyl-prolyl isomerase
LKEEKDMEGERVRSEEGWRRRREVERYRRKKGMEEGSM